MFDELAHAAPGGVSSATPCPEPSSPPVAARYLALSHELYALLSAEGVLLEASGAWGAVLGRAPSELTGCLLPDLMDGADGARLLGALRDALADVASVAELTTRCRHVDGSPRMVAWRFGGCDTPGAVVAAGKDITELDARTSALQDSEARFHAVQEATPDGVMLFRSIRDARGRIVDFVCARANPAAERLTRRSRRELEGKRLLDEFPGNAVEGLFDAYVAVVETGTSWQGETAYTRDGLDIGLRITAVKQGDGFAVAFSDITDRLRAQAVLQTERTHLERLFQLSPAFICTLRGPDHVFEMANDTCYELVGLRDLVGRPMREAIPEACAQGFIELLDQVLATGEPFVASDVPIRLEREPNAPAERRYVSFVYLPLEEGDGSRSGIFVHGVDVTDHVHAVEALRETEARFEHLSANVPGMVFQFALHPDGTVTFPFVSEGARQIFGLSPEEIQDSPRTAAARIHPDDRDEYERTVATSAATLEPWAWEGRVVGAAETVRWVRGVSRPERQPDGSIVWDGVLLDVSEQRRAELERQEAERRYRSLFDHNPDAVFSFDREGRFTSGNPALERVLGHATHELLGRSFVPLIPPEQLASTSEHFKAALNGEARRYVTSALHRDGRTVDVAVTNVPILVGGEVTGVFGIARDLTEQRHAEEALRRSEARFRTMMEQAADIVAIVDATGAIRYANPPFARGLGYPDEEVLGQAALSLVHPEDLPRATDALRAAVTGAAPLRIELRVRHCDGSWRLLDLLVHSLLADPDVAGIVVSGRDVTEHRRLEAQVRQSQRIEAIGKLAGGIAHDFNNLITVIKVHCELLTADTAPSDPRYEDLLEIGKAAERAAGLTRQLLAFSRRQILNPQPVDLNEVVRNLGGMLARLIGEDIETVFALAPDLGIVLADPGQLEQVVINLAVNARDAMPDGGRLTIETRRVELDCVWPAGLPTPLSGTFVQLLVRDTGVGMSAEVRSRLFEPFFTTKEPGRGTGLGLATVYGIVKQSSGYIWCDSEPGQGTTFTICLPVGQGSAGEGSSGEASRRAESPASAGPATVLLVEDESTVRELAKRILIARGHHVLEAANGMEALALAETHGGPIDLLLTDAVMPKMGGAELARALRERRPQIKVLFMSGYTDDEMLRRGFTEDASTLIQKPFAATELARRVRELLDAGA